MDNIGVYVFVIHAATPSSGYRDLFSAFTSDQLYQITFVQMARTEDIRLDYLLQATLCMIVAGAVAGNVYKDLCLRNTHTIVNSVGG